MHAKSAHVYEPEWSADGGDRRRGRPGRTALVIGVSQRSNRAGPASTLRHVLDDDRRTPPSRANVAREWLNTMMLIRRFEERAGEMYAKAKVGGFLHLAIGEEATIVGSTRACATTTTSSPPIARTAMRWCAAPIPTASWPSSSGASTASARAAAGRCTCSTSRSASWAATGSSAATCRSRPASALASDYLGTEDATLCTFGDGASNQGTFGETHEPRRAVEAAGASSWSPTTSSAWAPRSSATRP